MQTNVSRSYVEDLHLVSAGLQKTLLDIRGDKTKAEARRDPEYRSTAKALSVNDKLLCEARKSMIRNRQLAASKKN